MSEPPFKLSTARTASVPKVAGILDVHVNTVRNMVADGRLTAIKISRNCIRIDLDSVDQLGETIGNPR